MSTQTHFAETPTIHSTIGQAIHDEIEGLTPINLDQLNELAALQTRKDRKYILNAQQLAKLLSSLDRSDSRILDTGGLRWFHYESVYFDTPELDSYRLAATMRPNRFKVRTRTYLDSDYCVLEVKTKSRRGKTVKTRQDHEVSQSAALADDARSYLAEFPEVAPYADDLEPTLRTRYERATIVFPSTNTRATIDAELAVADADGHTTGLVDEYIVETKSAGEPSKLDRQLWSMGIRPVKVSKFSTGLAALHPELAANRWNRVLVRHFGRAAAGTKESLGTAQRAA